MSNKNWHKKNQTQQRMFLHYTCIHIYMQTQKRRNLHYHHRKFTAQGRQTNINIVHTQDHLTLQTTQII